MGASFHVCVMITPKPFRPQGIHDARHHRLCDLAAALQSRIR
jgi:hypothetical protein